VLLIGHLDTVFELSSPFQRFALKSLLALQKAGVLDEMNIIVVMTGDEEHSGDPLSASKKDLIEAAKRADIAIGFEDGDGKFESAIVSRRSSSDWKLTVTGTPAHSSQVFTENVGAGAIFEASRILHEFYSTLSIEQDLTFNPGVILGGSTVEHDADMKRGNAFGKDNVVAKDVVVTGDIRAISPEQLKRAQEVMMNIVGKNLPQTKAEIVFGEGYPPLAPTEGNNALLAAYNKASVDVGYGTVSAVKPRNAGAADISFTSGFVDMALDGLGPRCSGGHTVNETADPRTIPMEARRVAILLYRLLAERGISKK
jgi:glutamate carboxypeptidase